MSNYEGRKTFYKIDSKEQRMVGVIYLKDFKDCVCKKINLEVLL